MKTSDPNILKQFMTVVNRKLLTEEVYNYLLKQWNLDKLDLDETLQKINEHKSGLSRSRREAVPYFIQLRDMLKQQKMAVSNDMSMTTVSGEATSSTTDSLTI